MELGGAAAFGMDILYLAHCVPTPPNKGDRIRAHYFVRELSRLCNVHLACFSRSAEEALASSEMREYCATVVVEPLHSRTALPKAGLHFLAGRSLTESFFISSRLRQRIRDEIPIANLTASLAYSSVMVQHAPAPVPLFLDMCDLDSEKWRQYSTQRRPAFLYALESRRLRDQELRCVARAQHTFLITEAEADLLRPLAPKAQISVVSNGVDFDYFRPTPPANSACNALVFVGHLGYFPNAEAARRFAREALPALRESRPGLEFWVVGRDPPADVVALSELPGVKVIASPPDVRPYVADSLAAVVPLELARGMQNKVLEALAMGKRVLFTESVARTFDGDLPLGCSAYASVDELRGLLMSLDGTPDPRIRESAIARFGWAKQAGKLLDAMSALTR